MLNMDRLFGARVVLLSLILATSLVLSACGGGDSPEPEAEPADTPAAAAQAEAPAEDPTEAPAETSAEAATETDETEPTATIAAAPEATEPAPVVVASEPAVCEAIEIPANDIPAISDVDWSKGPEDAPLTLVEYGDFQ